MANSNKAKAKLLYDWALWESECRAFFKEGQLYQIFKNSDPGWFPGYRPPTNRIIMFAGWEKTSGFPMAIFVLSTGEVKKAGVAAQISPRHYMRALNGPEDYKEGL